jgi:hypothetical protein
MDSKQSSPALVSLSDDMPSNLLTPGQGLLAAHNDLQSVAPDPDTDLLLHLAWEAQCAANSTASHPVHPSKPGLLHSPGITWWANTPFGEPLFRKATALAKKLQGRTITVMADQGIGEMMPLAAPFFTDSLNWLHLMRHHDLDHLREKRTHLPSRIDRFHPDLKTLRDLLFPNTKIPGAVYGFAVDPIENQRVQTNFGIRLVPVAIDRTAYPTDWSDTLGIGDPHLLALNRHTPAPPAMTRAQSLVYLTHLVMAATNTSNPLDLVPQPSNPANATIYLEIAWRDRWWVLNGDLRTHVMLHHTPLVREATALRVRSLMAGSQSLYADLVPDSTDHTAWVNCMDRLQRASECLGEPNPRIRLRHRSVQHQAWPITRAFGAAPMGQSDPAWPHPLPLGWDWLYPAAVITSLISNSGDYSPDRPIRTAEMMYLLIEGSHLYQWSLASNPETAYLAVPGEKATGMANLRQGRSLFLSHWDHTRAGLRQVGILPDSLVQPMRNAAEEHARTRFREKGKARYQAPWLISRSQQCRWLSHTNKSRVLPRLMPLQKITAKGL